MSVFILQNLKKSYVVNKKEHVVLKDISLTFPDKGLVSIVGKSGSGKSTLLNILMGIEKPTNGKAIFKGKDISKFSDKEFSSFHLRGIATVFQHYNLFDDLTAFENVILPLNMQGICFAKAKQKVEALFKDLNIENLMSSKTANLSGGEKQRVAILRAIITEPDVLLCDEPTGALDSKNSQEIMGILKKISKNTLVVMVSHNTDLVEQFSDHIIHIQDGHIDNQIDTSKNKFNEAFIKKKRAYSSSWIKLFLFKNFRKNLAKNIFTFVSCVVGFVSVFLCVGFLNGSEKSYTESVQKNLSIGNATVSKIESVVISDSPLTYQKTVRPDLCEVDEEFKEFSTIKVEDNLSYFISGSSSCSLNDKSCSNFQMVPLHDLALTNYGCDLLVRGSAGSNNFDEIIVNEEFANLFEEDVLNKELVFKNIAPTNYKTYDNSNPFIKDELIIEKTLKISGIIKEFPFLNTPKIYYSYSGARSFLKAQVMENLSHYLSKTYTYYDYLIDCPSDDIASSYSSLIFLKDLSESERFFKKIKNLKNTTLEVTSSASDIKETYQTFISSFSKTLFVFSIIVFVGINFILGMVSLSSFLQNRKETAIMTCLGGRNRSIYQLHLLENYLVVTIAYLVSIGLAILGQYLLNPYLSNQFALSNLIEIPLLSFLGIKFGLLIIFFLTVLITSTLFTLVPMFIYRHGYLSEELRDE